LISTDRRRPDTPLTALTEALKSDNWQVQQAVCAAIGDRGEGEALPAIADLLDAQDALGVYACPDEWDFDSAGSESERETWRCRFRVKQAALLAIGGCVARHGAAVVRDALREHIERYAVSQDEDYPVRTAACDLLSRGCRCPGQGARGLGGVQGPPSPRLDGGPVCATCGVVPVLGHQRAGTGVGRAGADRQLYD